MNQEDQLSVLSEEELLSQLVPQEAAKGLLQSYSSLYNLFLHISPRQMQEIKGVGEAKLKRLLCVREVMTRMQQYRTRTVRVVHGPEDVIKYFRYLEDRQQEELWLLMLNTKNHIIDSQQISVGTINASLVSPREVFHGCWPGRLCSNFRTLAWEARILPLNYTRIILK